jgi:uroporphyrinogen decarboxylase
MVGTERLLMAMVEQPEWVVDMFNHQLDMSIALFDLVWEAGYKFDGVKWWDDMGYKLNQFFSLAMYRELLKPVHQRAIEWAHAKGVKALLHSCGDIRPFVPELVGMGLDGLNPLEVKAGMDPVQIKQTFGDRLLLHGGINAVLWDDFEQFAAEMRRVVPELKRKGGYIFASDHSVPNSVSLETFRRTVDLAKQLGKY